MKKNSQNTSKKEFKVEFLTMRQVARFLHLREATIYRLIKQETALPAHEIASRAQQQEQ